MNYYFHLNNGPFKAIKNGKKKIETRIQTEHHPKLQFEGMKPGEKIIFNTDEGDEMTTEIIKVRHYQDIATLLDEEGQENVMSFDCSREEALVSWNTLTGYEEGIKKFGIWAIEVKPYLK
jgi:ASC-1-like (ASCH) protein